jgi:AcrR family transcriptional regulator
VTRRTQAERTAATRAALLDATIATLVSDGYAGVTTARIAENAGVTRGAQAHHFRSKAELVAETVHHLGGLVTEIPPPPAGTGTAGDVGRLVDWLWELHRSEPFTACTELWLAARTDDELLVVLKPLENAVLTAAVASLDRALPQLAGRAAGLRLLSTTLATMRGLALLRFVHDDIERELTAARRHLIRLWSEVLAEA